MPSSVRTFLPIVGDPSTLAAAFENDPTRWLPGARRDGPHRFTVTVRAGSLTRTVTASVGAPWRSGATRWRSVVWDPVADDGDPAAIDRLLPSLDGELGVHLEAEGRSTLVLDARYRPPGGALGAAADAVGLRRVARRTAQRFLEDVAAQLTAEALLRDDDAGTPAASSARGQHHLDDGPAPVGS